MFLHVLLVTVTGSMVYVPPTFEGKFMKALILSAGQGRRLLPYTAERPKSSLDVGAKSLLQWQLDELQHTPVREVVVITGFAASHLENIVATYDRSWARTEHNPFYANCDNLGTCWTARLEMQEPFLLINGDTLFESAIVNRLLTNSHEFPITLAADAKSGYDADDMKVSVDGDRLQRVGKDLEPEIVNGESIGMMVFRGDGPKLFCRKLDQMMRHTAGHSRWYLAAIDELARLQQVGVHRINGLSWCEVDDRADLAHAATVVATWPSAADAGVSGTQPQR